MTAALPNLDHASLLRRAFSVAARARANGNHPFGAILAGPDGTIILEQENSYLPDHDMTAHAERVLMSRASIAFSTDFLGSCTIYTSAEPCAMCAGAIYWAGVGRVVYGLAESDLKDRAPWRGVGLATSSRSPAGLAGFIRLPRRAA
jgi:tRNA(Arg) A34 adenosine deaminase TadA